MQDDNEFGSRFSRWMQKDNEFGSRFSRWMQKDNEEFGSKSSYAFGVNKKEGRIKLKHL